MKHNPKHLLAFLLAALLLLGASGCGGGGGTESVRLMVWSPSEDQSKDSGEWLQKCCNKFVAQHPEWNLTFVYGVADEATAADAISQDPTASADVFMYANDRITTLTDAQAVAKLGGKYRDQVLADCSEAIANSVTMDGHLYGVPYTTNTWFMYYDKRVFFEEDVQSLEAMLEKGVVSFPFTNSWYLPAFYFGNGCTLFGDGTQEELGADFGGENAAAVTDYLVDLIANPTSWWTPWSWPSTWAPPRRRSCAMSCAASSPAPWSWKTTRWWPPTLCSWPRTTPSTAPASSSPLWQRCPTAGVRWRSWGSPSATATPPMTTPPHRPRP